VSAATAETHEPRARFYFDLASARSYLAAERVLQVLPGPAEWQPVLARELGGPASVEALRCEQEAGVYRAQLGRRAAELDLQPLRWPDPFPFDSSLAMRVATYAKSIGRVVPFAQAAYRQAFAGGHSLEDADFVLIAAAACEMHPAAVLRAARMRSTADRLAEATLAAARAGVEDVPAVLVAGTAPGEEDRVFHGERALEAAGELLRVGALRARGGGNAAR
jgi:2-hydroxychromene-2-carboxylate isomerase